MEDIDLSGLHDIHQPIEPSWWPLAIGWWIVIGAILFILSIGGICYLIWWTRPKQYAIRELKRLYQSEPNPILFARGLSILLKRVALLKFPRIEVAQLSEKKWKKFINEKTPNIFSEDTITFLTEAIYMPETKAVNIETKILYEAGYKTIQQLFRKEKHGK